jgi:3-phosphoshikimate 1-carboxyvinyltransferase
LQSIQITKNNHPKEISLELPASKSESNRVLILAALAGNMDSIGNLSTARDTQTLIQLLKSREKTLDVIDAGTTMRFLTSYLSVTGRQKILTGTPRMCQRPIGILVDALRGIGARIEYVNQKGYPPLRLNGFQWNGIRHIRMRGDISSQFISAMLMIAPLLEEGLTITLTGKIGSRPYIGMTLDLMKHFGVKAEWEGNEIKIPHQNYQSIFYRVQPDWSGASYWYGIVALAEKATLELADFEKDSLQGDRIIASIMEDLGVLSTFHPKGVRLTKKSNSTANTYDFTDFPDLAQTVAVTCAAKGIKARFLGLESLKIKETDRIVALQHELLKIGADFRESAKGEWILSPSSKLPLQAEFETYEDHRMAMAFASLATRMNVVIQNAEVVNKSYPSFWLHFQKAGFKIFPNQ